MSDIYSALMGSPPTDSDQMNALAAALRRQQALGAVMQSTGDRVLGPQGQQLQGEVGSDVSLMQKARENQQQFQMNQQYRQDQAENMRAERANQLAVAAEMAKSREDVANTGAQSRITVADMNDAVKKAIADQKAIEKNYKPLPVKLDDELQIAQNQAQDFNGVAATYKPEYASSAGIFGGHALANSLAAMGIGTEGSKERQNWWANFNRTYNNPAIHAQFGARFTPAEMARWDAAMINPNMDDATIKKNLRQLQEVLERHRGSLIDNLKRGPYDPDQVEGYRYGGQPELYQPGKRTGATGSYSAPAAPDVSKMPPEVQKVLMDHMPAQ